MSRMSRPVSFLKTQYVQSAAFIKFYEKNYQAINFYSTRRSVVPVKPSSKRQGGGWKLEC